MPGDTSIDEVIEVLDDDELYRRIHPMHQRPGGKITSAAFKHKKPISVDIARLTTPERTKSENSKYWVASILTGFIRSLDLMVLHKPLTSNNAHAEISGNFTTSKSRELARSAHIVLE